MPPPTRSSFEKRFRRFFLGYKGRQIPLKDPPLRVPGQGLDQKIGDLLMDLGMKMGIVFTVPIIVFFMFIQSLVSAPLCYAILMLVISTPLALAIVVALIISMRRAGRELNNYQQGLLCERYVGQQLERCRYLGYSVFHDIEAEGANRPFNIDHIIVGPGGVMVFETKGRTQSKDEDWVIRYNGTSLTFPDGFESTKEVEQARAISDYVRKLLHKLLDTQQNPVCQISKTNPIPVRAFLLYPGWRIDYRQAKGAEVTVLAGSAMLEYIKGSPVFLTDKEYIELRELLGKHLLDQRRHLLED